MNSGKPHDGLGDRIAVLVILGVVLIGASAYFVWTRARAAEELRIAAAREASERESALEERGDSTVLAVQRLRQGSHLVFVEPRPRLPSVLAFAPLDADRRPRIPDGRVVTRIEAQRVYTVGDRIVVLGEFDGVEGRREPGAFVLDPALNVEHTFRVDGLPSRARGSADGQWAAATFFVTGDSYAGGGFSTRTYLIDLLRGGLPRDLESFEVTRDGVVVDAIDRNFWGVTFFDPPQRFLCTVRTGDARHLVEGDIASGKAVVLHAPVECPSLAPDQRRIAYKRLSQEPFERWAIATLDLATRTERILPGEQRSIDDQVEWLDDAHVLYGVPLAAEWGGITADVWITPVEGDGAPRVFLDRARSPCVVRP